MYLRKTKFKDLNIYWKWFNQPEVRENSLITNKKVKFKDHSEWFKNVITRNDIYMYVLVNNKILIGQIRIEKLKYKKLLINYSIDKKHRKKGYGKKIIFMILQKFKLDLLLREYKFLAKVKLNNISSNKIFQRLNFKQRKYKNLIIYSKDIS